MPASKPTPERESAIEAHLVRVVKLCNGIERKLQWIARKGAPDRCVFMPNGLVFWIELKRPDGTTESHQLREHDRLRAYGQIVEVLDTVKRIDDFFAPYFRPVNRQL